LQSDKIKKKEELAKQIEPTPQVDSQNFPILGASQPTEAKAKSILGHRSSQDEGSSRNQSKSKSKHKYDSERDITTEEEKVEPDHPKPRKKIEINLTPDPKVSLSAYMYRCSSLEFLCSICSIPALRA
jgi:hypothetical protein